MDMVPEAPAEFLLSLVIRKLTGLAHSWFQHFQCQHPSGTDGHLDSWSALKKVLFAQFDIESGYQACVQKPLSISQGNLTVSKFNDEFTS
ncbi:hypothetical protein HMI56_003391 [Coelomomyces lativittatus]|nr:hypothetical protein HMI56_003391 [Coelomomyces lativittatus]